MIKFLSCFCNEEYANGYDSVDEGARTPVMLALADIGGKAGAFWQGEKEIQW